MQTYRCGDCNSLIKYGDEKCKKCRAELVWNFVLDKDLGINEDLKKKKILGWILSLNLIGIGIFWIIVSTLFYLASNGNGLSYQAESIKTFLNRILGVLSLIGIPGTIIGLVILVKAYKQPTSNVEKKIKGLTESQNKFINSFSRGGFFLPTVMLFYTKQYGRAILCLLLSMIGSILGLIPRIIVGQGTRKWAYLNIKHRSFDEFKTKIQNMELICIIIGALLISIILIFIGMLRSI